MIDTLGQFVRDAFRDDATDVFLAEGEPPRIRRNGEISILHPGPVPREVMEEFWQKRGADPAGNIHEWDTSWLVSDHCRLRVHLYRTLNRLAAVLRPIRENVPPLSSLGLPEEILTSWISRRMGLILVTGPTSSGKSTTIASMLDWLNRHHSRHIVTLEDPIEYLFTNDKSIFSQREIRTDAASFTSGLHSALRQSPDVLFIGEIRDQETALTALNAAETGHLVIATMHSGSVTGAIDTLDRFTHLIGFDNSPALRLLSNQLIGTLNQLLLPRKNGGIVPALEYFQNEAATRRWIAEYRMRELQEYLHRSSSDTHCSMLTYLVAATEQGFIETDVARSACLRPQDFDRAMKGIS